MAHLLEGKFSMALPPPEPRIDLHTRNVTFRGYLREDKLWDIEAELVDVKAYALTTQGRGTLQPGTPIHDMAIRVTLDDTMTIRGIVTSMGITPFPECVSAEDPMQQLIGCTMGSGWRATIERNLGGIRGCTHLRELLFNMATAAYQTIVSYRELPSVLHSKQTETAITPPFHLGKCMAWDFNGAVVKRYEPAFFGWQPLRKKANPE